MLQQKKHSRILLELNELSHAETVEWELRLNKYRADCGCATGALVMLVSVTLYGIGLWFGVDGLPSGLWTRIGTGLAVLCSGVVIGKTVGIAWARHNFKGSVEKLEQLLAIRQNEHDHGAKGG